jgi:L-threonylcarbamoyladenylate synthase
MRIVPAAAEGIALAAEAIRRGEIAAYPTETVYGLGADPFSESALMHLFEIKGRDAQNPILLIVAGLDQLEGVAGPLSDRARAYAEAFWPGPLSLLLPKAPGLPDALTAGRGEVCVRCPGLETARALCRAAGSALTSTSANRSGQAPARSLDELDLPGVVIAIDGGLLPPSSPSTVFDPESGRILREGAISEAQLRALF